jgi:Cu(I)/Ag(I) efflux system membrane fusion protein/cobalt-zinc-cadmium efflux system membrane fusion protein
MNIKSTLLVIILTALITGTAVFFITTTIGPTSSESSKVRSEQNGDAASKERKIIYWKAPMDPTEIYDEPGKSKMGMDLVPVYEDEVSEDETSKDAADRKIVYWKAPMDPTEIYDEPGKSKMGMDLVPVYEDEVKGGVDIKINPVVEQNMGLKIKPVAQGPLNHIIKTYGHVTFDETRTGIVSPKTAGWVETLYADYTGFVIEKGDPLFAMYSPSLLASQEEYLSAYKNFQARRTPLNKDLLESAKKRLAYYDIADQDIAFLEQTGQVRKTLTIRSRFNGVVTHKNVIEGAYVKAGESLFTIADLSTVWVEAHIFEYEQNLVYEGQSVEMTLSYNPDKVYTGKIAYIFPYLQPRTRDVVIRIIFDNAEDDLKPDMFANIKINTSKDAAGLIIPSEAVIHSGEKQLVFVAHGNGRFSPRKITTGVHLEEGRVQVLTGLAQGEDVVVSGQFLLDSESRLKEAIQKMIASKSGTAKEKTEPSQNDGDSFFEDMEDDTESGDDFFQDMKDDTEPKDDFFQDME